jgi:type IV secretion system protein VirB9
VVPQTHTDKDKPTDQNLSSLPEKRNTAYTFSGSPELVPLRMFDDGTSTYLLWAEGTDFPAIYAIADQKESLVNFGYREGYIVIDQVAPAFILRRAELRAVLYNDNYIPPALDALSPQPRPEVSHRKRPKGLFGRSSDPTQNKRPN